MNLEIGAALTPGEAHGSSQCSASPARICQALRAMLWFSENLCFPEMG